MNCPKCGAEAAEGSKFCSQCGATVVERGAAPIRYASVPAILSLAFGILTLLPFLGIPLGIAAIVLGIVALRRIALWPEKLTGQGLAIAGIIVASVLIVVKVIISIYIAPIAVPAFMEGRAHGQAFRAAADMETIATALEAYYADHKCYPAWATGEEGANSFAGPQASVYRVPTFRIWKDSNEYGTFHTLTTPTAYVPTYYRDPFSDTEGATFCYYSDGQGWIMWSWGPDRDESKPEQWDLAADVQRVYSSEDLQPTLTLLTGTSSAPAHEAYTYDPTNGIFSPGDIWRLKQ
jgi:Tfp pilus assembly protein PilE